MVYCGRPAASCAPCRAKKKRCDKALPACGQCRRTGQTCPGYHDASSLIFRDETTRVIDRARHLEAQRVALAASVEASTSSALNPSALTLSSATPSSATSALSPSTLTLSSPSALTLSPSDSLWDPSLVLPDLSDFSLVPDLFLSPSPPANSLHDAGVNYFLANYTLPNSGPCPGFLNYTMDVLAGQPGGAADKDGLAALAVRVAGLAGLANTTGAEGVMRQARRGYAEAIERVNAALADGATALADTTIFTVLVLGLFETITCASDEALDAWKSHVDGAAHLLIHRGTAQFRTRQGLQIFGEALSHVLTLCSRFGRALPPRLRFLRVEMERTTDRKAPSWLLVTAHIEVMELFQRVDPDCERPSLPGEWEALLSHAAELDRRLETTFAALPPCWNFITVHDPGASPRIVFRGTYHVYYNPWVAKVWDGIRACRIILYQVVYTLLLREGLTWAPHELAPGAGAYADLLPRVLDTTTQMRDGILSSVPQMLGFVHHDPATGASYLETSSTGDMAATTPALGAYFLLWYLFLAGSLPVNTSETRAWVVDRLRAIRAATGIQKADYLADALESESVRFGAVLLTNDFLLPSF